MKNALVWFGYRLGQPPAGPFDALVKDDASGITRVHIVDADYRKRLPEDYPFHFTAKPLSEGPVGYGEYAWEPVKTRFEIMEDL